MLEYPRPGVYVTDLRDRHDIQIYGDVYAGSNLQKLSLIMDTGSSALWFSSIFCLSCAEGSGHYDNTNSTTFRFDRQLKHL